MADETEMVLRVARAISGAPFPSAKSIAKARAAIWAMKSPTRETNTAICKGQPREFHVPMQLGYERGLDAALGDLAP